MKTKIVLMITIGLIVFLSSITFAADNKDFYESGQIVDGEVWNMVNIYNDDTVVDMSGGLCDFVSTHDRSTLNVTGGSAEFRAVDYSDMNISGGVHSAAVAWNNATINVFNNADLIGLSTRSFGTLNISGGLIQNLHGRESGIVNLYGGMITDHISANDYSFVNVYGYDLDKESTGGSYGYGQVFGYWMNNNPFVIDIYDSETFSRINLIPEPSSMFLVGLGALFLKTKKEL